MSEQTQDQARRALLQNALQAVEQLQGKLDAAEHARTEPIAIVGLGCRFPGGADSPEAYWSLLESGFDAVTAVPADRWSPDVYAEIDPETAAKMPPPRAGFLKRIDEFDAQFFGIAPREAIWMDPQHRFVLEVAWEALEHAGIAPEQLRGTRTGVFLGITAGDYALNAMEAARSRLGVHIVSGITPNAAAGRVAYLLGLHGPCMAIDTACSSSLTAIHLACQSLRNGESSVAIAGGVHALVRPEHFVTFFKWGMIAADGHCKTFDASADGFVRAEGCGILVLKRLSDAIADGDRVLAVIRGSSVNQDGASGGLTVPNGLAQEAVIQQALDSAGVRAADVDYVEAHGTGTSLGDPIELEALDAVMSAGRPADRPLAVGSVKTNMGHLEAASGVAGVIKVVLSLLHERIPPHLHFNTLTPKATMRRLQVVVPTAPLPWTAGNRRRVAGISGFGFSGTNVHVVIEEAPASQSPAAATGERLLEVVTLSAKSDEALRELASRWVDGLSGTENASLVEIAHTAHVGRAHFSHRAAVVAASTRELRDQLTLLRDENVVRSGAKGEALQRQHAKIAFLYTGQGSQYAGMGRGLFATEAVFREALERCDALLRPHMDRPLLDVLYDDATGLIDSTGYTQPVLFAFEYALTELWRSWGVTPHCVIGHSLGEYVAACTAGVLSLDDALTLVAARARMMQALPAGGAMAAVLAAEARVRPVADRHGVSIAAINAPESVVISGARAAVARATAELERQGIVARELPVSHAFHSALMDPVLDSFERVVAGLTLSSPRIAIASNLTGAIASGDLLCSPAYWRRHLREPVRFRDGLAALGEQGCSIFLEIGPTPTLASFGQRSFEASEGLRWLSSLRRGQDDSRHIAAAVANLYVSGGAIDWRAFEGIRRPARAALPTYPFQRQRYWLEPDKADAGIRPVVFGATATGHPLLGHRIDSPLETVLFERRLAAGTVPFLADHVVEQTVLFPATAHVELALAAARESMQCEGVLENLVLNDPMPLGRARDIQVVLTRKDGRSADVRIFSRIVDAGAGSTWTLHASADVHAFGPEDEVEAASLVDAKARCRERVSVDEHYAQMDARGIQFGEAFRGVTALWRGTAEALGEIRLTAGADADSYVLHPALLDACFQVLAAAAPASGEPVTFLPIGLDRVRVFGSLDRHVWSHGRFRPSASSLQTAETLVGDITIYDTDGVAVASADGLRLKRADRAALRRAVAGVGNPDEWLFEIVWERRDLEGPAAGGIGRRWLVLSDGSALGESVATRARERGDEVTVFPRGAEIASPCAFTDIVDLWPLGAETVSSAAEIETEIERGCGSLLALVQQILNERSSQPPALYLVTRGAQAVAPGPVAVAQAPVWGLARSIRTELPELRCISIDLDPADADGTPEALFDIMVRRPSETQIALRQEQVHVARLVPLRGKGRAARLEPVELTIASRGILENLELKPAERRAPAPGEVEIEIAASGLNFRDVLNAMGMYPGDPGALGNECVGIVTRAGTGVDLTPGQRVVALTTGAFRTFVTTPAVGVAPMPEALTFDEAATIPIVFMTSVYSLDTLATLGRGQRVLIHAGAGGVGLSAIQVAQRAGAEIFATAGTPEKRALLKSLGVQHVFDSRSLEFSPGVLSVTNGEGVDVVLNSLAGDFIPASIAALRHGGTFLELGKTDIWTPERVAALRPDAKYHAIYLGELPPAVLGALLRDVLADFDNGTFRPLPQHVFALDDAVSAFRFMAQAKHIGKVVLRPVLEAQARSEGVRAGVTYLITGGCGGLGIYVAEWLAAKGARHLVLMGRSAPSADAQAVIDRLLLDGVKVAVVQGDVSRSEDVVRAVAAVDRDAPIAGIVHAAGILDDGVLLQQTWDRFAKVLAPKVAGAWNLQNATWGLPLDFFVMFSSAASVFGAPGQGNYAAANAFLDALAADRRGRGFAGLSVNWGPWAGAGMAAATAGQDQRRWSKQGVAFIPAEDGVRLLGDLLEGAPAQVTVLPVDARAAAQAFTGGRAASASGTRQPRRSGAESTDAASLIERLKRVPAARRRNTVLAHVREQVAAILDFDPSAPIAPNQGLRDLGMDSLMAVELRSRLQGTLGRPLPATLAFDDPTIEALTRFVMENIVEDLPSETVAEPAAARPIDGTEPIAIIGIGCRVPGGGDTPDAFWELLRNGVDAISEVPRDRWDLEEYYDADADAPGKMYARHGGFLAAVDQFEPKFFGISPREAISLDPQQRLLLEVSWEALENAGQSADRLTGTKTGVFVGLSSADYAQLQMKVGDPAKIDAYFGTGNSPSVAAGRLSYSLGLQGPSMAVDTACSSSLVAVHLACQSLRSGESRLALAGGVNLILAPEAHINFSRARMLARDGRCKTFDAAADGYVRGEGAGIVVLKRLSDARADGDRVLALVRGSAVNQDGRSSGLTVPNGPAQQTLLRDALATAGIAPREVSYVEAHGTGTSLGDPIEMHSLAAVFGADRTPERPLVVGSVKTNVGHLEAAAGVTGLIKIVLAMQHGEIPPHLHFKTLNPHIALDGFPVVIPTSAVPWLRGGAARIAGVSAFGFGGTNAHVVLEEPPAEERTAAGERALHPITLSAKSEGALKEIAARLASWIETDPPALGDLAYTLNAGRAHLSYRAAFVAGSQRQVQERLAQIARGDRPTEIRYGFVEGVEPSEVVFVFTGDGAEYAGRARELYETQPTFRRELDACDRLLSAYLPAPLLPVLISSRTHAQGDSAADDQFRRLSLFATQYSLAQLWRSWGLQPAAVMGYDGGQYAAGCVAGVFSLEDAAKLAAASTSPDFSDLARAVAFASPRVPILSHRGGTFATDEEIAAAAFWRQSAETARPSEGIETFRHESYRLFVEIGHTPATEETRRIVEADGAGLWLPSLSSGRGDWEQMLGSLLALHATGVAIDWTRFGDGDARRKVALPTYPFQRQRYWIAEGESPLAPGAADDLDAVIAAGHRQAQEGPLDLNLHSFAGKWCCLERLTTAYIIQAFRGLGVFVTPGERHSADELVARCDVLPAYRKLVGRWLERLVREDRLRMDEGVYVGVTPLADPHVEAVWQDSTDLADVPFLIDYITRCGKALQGVVTGRESPLETLFPGGSVDCAEQLYERSAASRYINGIARAVTAAHVAARGHRGTVSVLEIGAGTGATSSAVLPSLPRASASYWFTDVSEFFLRRAETKLRAYDFVRYGLLDIEKAPETQGYPVRLFDVVIAANALHATGNIHRTLEHARSLLAPGGILVLAEDTVYHAFFDITIALIEGWQRFEDDIRDDHPLLSTDQWQRALGDAGFDKVIRFPEAGSPTEVIGQSVFVARAPLSGAGAGAPGADAWVTRVQGRRAGLADGSPDSALDTEPLVRRVSEALPAEREELLIDYVRGHVAGVLRLEPTAMPERRQRLMDLGLDSLMAVELRNRLASGIGSVIVVPATLMFDYPTIDAIAQFLGQQLAAQELPAPAAAPAPAGPSEADALSAAAARLADVSEEEAEALLIQRLQSL
jgi:acyl transferase domain-containing protein/acyl carrier protein/SAM-dependent methyltransferase